MERTTHNDRRRSARGSAIHGGSLLHKAVLLRCVVSDVSPTGARVHLLAAEPCPETVLLELPGGAVRPARRRWQSGIDVGFEFIESDDAS